MLEHQYTEDEVIDIILKGIAESLTRDTKRISPNERITLTKDSDGAMRFDLVSDKPAD